jgi:hypothetical protein
MTFSTRSSEGTIGGVLPLDHSLRIRGTSSRRLESSSSKGIPIEGGSRVERIISGWKGYIPDFLKADSIVEGLKHLPLARIYAEVHSTRRIRFDDVRKIASTSEVIAVLRGEKHAIPRGYVTCEVCGGSRPKSIFFMIQNVRNLVV